MGPWAPGPLAEGRLAWAAPGWIRGRLAAVVAGGGSCAASPLLRWPSLPFRGSWCWGGCPLPRLVAPVWLRTALPCPVLVGGAPHWAPVWQGRSSTRHRSGFLWAPPTQDTGRCSTRDIYWSLQAGGIRRADGKLVMTLAPLSSVCVDGWFILGCHDCSCTPGVQPHPARVQSVWLRPGEAVNQPSTTHTLHSEYMTILTIGSSLDSLASKVYLLAL